MALPAIAGSIGQRAMQYAAANAPQIVESAKQYIARSGKDIDVLASRVGDRSAQAAVMVALGKGGLSGDMFATAEQLTPSEIAQFKRELKVMNDAAQRAVDGRQVNQVGDAASMYLARLNRNSDIEFACRRINVTSDQLARLITCFASITSQDIELYQLDSKRAVK